MLKSFTLAKVYSLIMEELSIGFYLRSFDTVHSFDRLDISKVHRFNHHQHKLFLVGSFLYLFENVSKRTTFLAEVVPNPTSQQLPLIVSRQLDYPHPRYPPLQAWLETLGQKRDEKLGIVDLHPSIWQTSPRYFSAIRSSLVRILLRLDWMFSMKMSNGRKLTKKL